MNYVSGTIVSINFINISVLGKDGNIYRVDCKKFKYLGLDKFPVGTQVWVLYSLKKFKDWEVTMMLPWSNDEDAVVSLLSNQITKP